MSSYNKHVCVSFILLSICLSLCHEHINSKLETIAWLSCGAAVLVTDARRRESAVGTRVSEQGFWDLKREKFRSPPK